MYIYNIKLSMDDIMEYKKILVSTLIAILILGTIGLSGCVDEPEDEDMIGVQVTRQELMVTWDPAESFTPEIMALHNMYETLLKYHPFEDELEGVLAEDWSVSDDDLTWTFELREEVEFQTGGEMTAEDVKFSVERIQERGRGAAFIWSAVEDIEVVDDYTVKFHLSNPAPIDLISASAYGAWIYSKEKAEEVDDLHEWMEEGNACGTGPYRPESWESGDTGRLVMEKFDNYWRGWDPDTNHFDKVVIRSIPEATTARQELEAGEVHHVEKLPVTELEAVEKDPEVELMQSPAFENLYGPMDVEKAPTDCKYIRKAISYATPYDDIVDEVWGGYATQSRGALPSGMWGHSDEIHQYEYDIDKAQEMVEKSEYADNIEDYTIEATYTGGDDDIQRTLELIQSELDKIGINMELRSHSTSTKYDIARNSDPEDRQHITTYWWWPDVCSPDSWLSSCFLSEDEPYFNLAYWGNDTVDDLILEAREMQGIDRDRAEEIYIEAQQIIVEEAPYLFLVDRDYVRAVRTELGGFEDNPAYPHVIWWYDCYLEA